MLDLGVTQTHGTLVREQTKRKEATSGSSINIISIQGKNYERNPQKTHKKTLEYAITKSISTKIKSTNTNALKRADKINPFQ